VVLQEHYSAGMLVVSGLLLIRAGFIDQQRASQD
jgi:hypothetical protein